MEKSQLIKHVPGLTNEQAVDVLKYLHWKLEEIFHDKSYMVGDSISDFATLEGENILRTTECKEILNEIKLEIEL